MQKISVRTGILIGILLIAPLLAVLFLAATLLGVSFPVFPVFDFIARLLPGQILTFGIDAIVDTIRFLNLGRTDTTAKTAEQIMAIVVVGILGILCSVTYFALVQRHEHGKRPLRFGLISGSLFGVIASLPVLLIVMALDRSTTITALVNVLWLIIAFAAWGAAHGFVYTQLTSLPVHHSVSTSEVSTTNAVKPISRRQFLIQLGGTTATITLVGTGLSAWQLRNRLVDTTSTDLPTVEAPVVVSDNLLQPAPGTRPEYTPLANHYRIDINTGSPPALTSDTYKLILSGLVENPTELTLDQIRSDYTPMDQIITMSCISNHVAGDLISTIRWTGISMQDVLALVKPTPEATHIKISGADGFYEVLDLDLIRADKKVMLTYAWDEQPLPERHGFPLRIHIPDRYGMKQPKWITHMEFIPEWEPGYWVERGWDKEALVNATSVIDTVAVEHIIDDKLVPIGGMAWAGARGISRVEVQVDHGEWMEAQLRPPLSDKSWVIWRYDWSFTPGNHTFAVRCHETDGTPQIESERGVRPSGATGIHQVSANI